MFLQYNKVLTHVNKNTQVKIKIDEVQENNGSLIVSHQYINDSR